MSNIGKIQEVARGITSALIEFAENAAIFLPSITDVKLPLLLEPYASVVHFGSKYEKLLDGFNMRLSNRFLKLRCETVKLASDACEPISLNRRELSAIRNLRGRRELCQPPADIP